MPDARSFILALNGGSSSIKFALFSAIGPLVPVLRGGIERIGSGHARLQVAGEAVADRISQPVTAVDHRAAVEIVLDWLDRRCGPAGPAAIGHRIVHGGPAYAGPQSIDGDMIEALRRLSALDPQHLPSELHLVEAAAHRFPDVPQVACFDTAFHHDMPRLAQILPIPRRYETMGMRRYGFHGLSYGYLMGELARIAGNEAAQGRVILAHLGSGASLAAVKAGRPIDTSMGLTPASGIPMGTRSGDLDPGLFAHLERREGLDAQAFDRMVNAESGLLGISETSADIRDLLDREAEDVRAAEAVSFFCYQVRKWIGGFAAALGGLDTLIFSGGIGEHASVVRARICEELGFLGICLDPRANAANAAVISTDARAVTVRVMPTDEERMIADLVRGVLAASHSPEPTNGSA